MTDARRSTSSRRGADELLALLIQRDAFLDRLAEDLATKAELLDTLGVSRSTVDRAIRDLRAAGLVDRGADGYQLTTQGELALDLYDDVVDDLATIRAVAGVLDHVPPTDIVHVDFLRGGTAFTTEDTVPPDTELRRLVTEADELWTMTPAAHFELLSLAHRRVVEDGLDFELIHSADSLDRLLVHHPDIVEATLRTGRLELYRADTVPSVGLLKAVIDGARAVALLCYGTRGRLQALVQTHSDAAIDRFETTFHRHRTAATPVQTADIDQPS